MIIQAVIEPRSHRLPKLGKFVARARNEHARVGLELGGGSSLKIWRVAEGSADRGWVYVLQDLFFQKTVNSAKFVLQCINGLTKPLTHD